MLGPGAIRTAAVRLARVRQPGGPDLPESRTGRDERLTAMLRLALAAGALPIYLLVPGADPARRPYAYAVLALFLTYSALAYQLALRGRRRPSLTAIPWIDLGWTTLLVAVSEGTSSIFYPLYIFAILCASFQGRPRQGREITLSAVLLFGIVGGATAPRLARFELDRTLFRPLYLLVVGYLIAYWGEYETQHRARLELLRNVTTVSNPRFGIERMLGSILAQLRRFYAAESCRLVVADAAGQTWTRVATATSEWVSRAVPLPADLASALLGANPTSVLLFGHPRRSFRLPSPQLDTFDVADGTHSRLPAATGEALASALGGRSFVSVPFRYDASAIGRIVVTSQHRNRFDDSDVHFVKHVIDQAMPALENVRLVDRLASDAADEERRRVARDLHDSIIQPYVGLRLGIAAARHSIDGGRAADAARVLDRLAVMAEDEIENLRKYVRRLRDGEPVDGREVLPDAVRRFCDRFSNATGIAVDVQVNGAAELADRLAAETFHMVTEALSNIRRHTDAARATVRIAVADGRLHLAVENDGAPAGAQEGFSPQSLHERAAALGGTLTISHTKAGTTALSIEVPL